MTRYRIGGPVLGSFLLLVCLLSSCTTAKPTRALQDPPPSDLKPQRIDYSDNEGFDALLESALLNQEPVIEIQTGHRQPDWDGRLNAWLAAWNLGGPVQASKPGRRARMQAAVVVDGDSIREFRLLVEGLMNRVEGIARERSAWWTEEKLQTRRVALLKPYNLRFHKNEAGLIQIILFNGRYAEQYREHVQSLATPDMEESGDQWARSFTCSLCKQKRRGSEEESTAPGKPGG